LAISSATLGDAAGLGADEAPDVPFPRTLNFLVSSLPLFSTENPVTSAIFTRNACVKDIDWM